MRLLSFFLRRVVRHGTLHVIAANGEKHSFHQEGCQTEPEVTLYLHDDKLPRELFFNPELAAGEAYMDGRLHFKNERGLDDFLRLFTLNAKQLHSHWPQALLRRFWRSLRRFQQFNTLTRARQNVSHHYDLSNELYRLFLDEDMQYSCAYFRTGEETLEQAQHDKKAHIAAKLCLAPGQRILDIGCGWGGMALYLASLYPDNEILGITLSQQQLNLARQRAEAAGVADRVRFELMDYRKVEGPFDRIVSVGMFEHVGAYHYGQFFRHINRLLKEDGLMLLHSIGRISPPGTTAPWIRKYIFPGGYTPALSEVLAATERNYLWVNDIEVLRLHYAQTLHHWRQRFYANRPRAEELLDERFCRMWDFYLTLAEHAFRHGTSQVFQMQLSKTRAAAPLTRDYQFKKKQEFLDSTASDRN